MSSITHPVIEQAIALRNAGELVTAQALIHAAQALAAAELVVLAFESLGRARGMVPNTRAVALCEQRMLALAEALKPEQAKPTLPLSDAAARRLNWLPTPDLMTAGKITDPLGSNYYYTASTVARLIEALEQRA